MMKNFSCGPIYLSFDRHQIYDVILHFGPMKLLKRQSEETRIAPDGIKGESCKPQLIGLPEQWCFMQLHAKQCTDDLSDTPLN